MERESNQCGVQNRRSQFVGKWEQQQRIVYKTNLIGGLGESGGRGRPVVEVG